MNTSVILIAYHGDRWLPPCLSSLEAASVEQLHLVLVDNNGNTEIDQLDLSAFDAEILRTPRPMGFAEANNFALVNASHLEEAVLFLNQDTVSQPGWIDQCLECFRKVSELGAVSPLIHTYSGEEWDSGFLSCISSEDALQRLTSNDTNGEDWFYTKHASAPALLVRTDVLQHVGPFDPIFGSYYEDFDLCRRIRRAGYAIAFCRSAHVNHYSGSSTNSRAREHKRMRQIIRNRIIYQLRESDESRLLGLTKYVLVDLPRRLARGLLRTPSSQPPLVTLKAYGDLVRIVGRLLSHRRDQAAWQAYLEELDWVTGMSSRRFMDVVASQE